MSEPFDSDPELTERIARILELPEAEQAAAFTALRREHPAQYEFLIRCEEAAQRIAPSTEADSVVDALLASRRPSEEIPEAIGPYEPLEVLGEGGMGTVYLAEQRHPVRRRVALKVIKLGMDTKQVLARFETERQALALMEHDNIAKVLDGGATADGRPYFVMEYVEGLPLTKHCDAQRMNVEQRLALFQDVCRGVQHAHQKGVVHRDLKPSNILVQVQSGRAVPKIIDFGLARAVGQDLSDQTLLTAAGQVVGTPEYMSPEQVDLGHAGIDTRADVHALGALLYELLTGQLPLPDLREHSLSEMQRRIREVEAPLPSVRVHGVESEQAAALRALDPAGLSRRLRHDLDWITMKALEKDRDRRYATADALVEDLRRHLEHEPVDAGPPSASYRLRKFLRKRRGQVFAVGAAIFAAIAVPTALLLYGAWQAAENRHLARDSVTIVKSKLEELRGLAVRTIATLDQLDRRNVDAARKDPDVDWHELWERRDALRDRVAMQGIRRRELEYEIRGEIARARRLDPAIRSTDRLALEASVEHLRIMQRLEATRDPMDFDWLRGDTETTFYRQLVRATDSAGDFAEELDPVVDLHIESEPQGAEVYLFEFRSLARLYEGAPDRLVPVPYRTDLTSLPVRPGTVGLRVVEALDSLRQNDFLFELEGHALENAVFVASTTDARVRRADRLMSIDGRPVRSPYDAVEFQETVEGPKRFAFARAGGTEVTLVAESLSGLGIEICSPLELASEGGIRATLYSLGLVREVDLPKGLLLRPTASPLLLNPSCRVGTTPVQLREVPTTVGLALLRRDGHEDVRRTVPPRSVLWLPRVGQGPPEFVSLEYTTHPKNEVVRRRMLDREVTCREYLEFLNDPETLGEIRRSERPIRFPRETANLTTGGFWPRDPRTGRYSIPTDWKPTWPIVGVSWHDATAYAAWRTRKAKRAGRSWVFALPHRTTWNVAAHEQSQLFPWGHRFRPTWTKSCFARKKACLEPTLSYPTDETPLGFFDMAGSASEWLLDGGELMECMGGSWADTEPSRLRAGFFNIEKPNLATMQRGFRLVVHVGGG